MVVEWGRHFKEGRTEEERRQYADAPDQPTLLLSGPFGRLRVSPPPEAVKVLGDDLDPLLDALARQAISRLPWPITPEDRLNFLDEATRQLARPR